MAQDHPEQESKEKTAEEQPEVEIKEQRTKEEQKIERPTIPDTQKPNLPQEENIPTGGPGDQNQTQQTSQPQTQEEKIKKIKDELKKPIHTDTPRERKESSELEDKHNKDVLNQP